MKLQKRIKQQRKRRAYRVRNRVRKSSATRLRLSVFRSNKQIYAQIIDDVAGRTVVSASSVDPALRAELGNGGNKDAAAQVGKLLAERAVAQGVKRVALDRGRFGYHGRIAALADAAREGGLEF